MNDLESFVGETVTYVEASENHIQLTFESGRAVMFYHRQDCCESVLVEDVNGDWDDLIGTPLLVADRRDSDRNPELASDLVEVDVDLWTFYTFRTVKGSVDVRWHGTSNGYYSMAVGMKVYEAPKKVVH